MAPRAGPGPGDPPSLATGEPWSSDRAAVGGNRANELLKGKSYTQPTSATDVQLVNYNQDSSGLIQAVHEKGVQDNVTLLPAIGDQPVNPISINPQTPTNDIPQNGIFPEPAADNVQDENTFLQSLQSGQQTNNIGSRFYRSDNDFSQGLVIEGDDVAMKIGGYVKLDAIHDFNAIDCTDEFDVKSIPVGAPRRTNTRLHTRQTRLNFDTRWQTDRGDLRVFVGGDFFGDGNGFRLRHAYGELGRFLGGQTWTTFANVDAAPATLDFEGSISAISPRRALVRWTKPVYTDQLKLALALEDSTTAIEIPPGGPTGETRTPSPDFVARLRWTGPNGNLQVAGIARQLGFQPIGGPVNTGDAWGLNFSQVAVLTSKDKVYWQINYGDGIASLLGGLPDIVPTGTDTATTLGYFGWMLGTTHQWNKRVSTNFTFAESHFNNTSGQLPTDINNLTYLAANVIWTPLERVNVGVEYLYGKRENISGASGLANRIQFAVFYYLP